MPDDIESAHKLLIAGQQGCRVHHNCSGKHAGFLTTALHLGMPLDGFHQVDHPLQQLSLASLSELAHINVRDYPMGIDGCGFPRFDKSVPIYSYRREINYPFGAVNRFTSKASSHRLVESKVALKNTIISRSACSITPGSFIRLMR